MCLCETVVANILSACVGEFGIVYRGSLNGWMTKGQQNLVAAKTLKGTM